MSESLNRVTTQLRRSQESNARLEALLGERTVALKIRENQVAGLTQQLHRLEQSQSLQSLPPRLSQENLRSPTLRRTETRDVYSSLVELRGKMDTLISPKQQTDWETLYTKEKDRSYTFYKALKRKE